ncbi:uncharacterized protein LOC113798935 [Dermatophagoides pteronyssinus]|uniref:uncharacterized protein LOC113798935 n=1 Tax=Dermatophagoides pteronyssinus TaxID=6956 RepID=UPI003F6621C0
MKFIQFNYYSLFCFYFISIIFISKSSAKRLRLPMLLRSNNKFECYNNVCIFSVKGFTTVQKNDQTTRLVSDDDDSKQQQQQQNQYHLQIKEYSLLRMARFYFKASFSSMNDGKKQQTQSKTNIACLIVDYLVNGDEKYQLIISQQSTETGKVHVLNQQQQQIKHYDDKWNTIYVNLEKENLEKDTFIFEVICQKNCTNGSTFSLLRININQDKCLSTTLPKTP